MATAPATTFSSRSKPAKKWAIRLGPTDGTSPDETHETTLLRHPVITLGHGARGTHAVVDYNLAKKAERIQDTYLKAGFARQVEILQPSEDPDAQPTLLFWGEIGEQQLSVDPRGEFVSLRVTIEPYHFGSACLGPKYREPVSPHANVVFNDVIVFNPEIRGIIEGNQSEYSAEPAAGQEHFYFVHPESTRTSTAITGAQDGDNPSEWTLADAVRTMQWICNPSETYITNASHDDLDRWLADAADVRNLELPTGRYLPDYLDLMLTPFGYGWAMTFRYDDTGERVVSYRIYKLNDGENRKLLQQRPGDSRGIRQTLSNVESFRIETGIVAQANEVLVLGDYEEYEVTIELYRGFAEAQDALSAAALTQSTGASWATNQRAWRLWVANEAGDYGATRSTVKPIPAGALDLSTVLGSEWIPRRLRAEDCLTYWVDEAGAETKRRRPPFAEWYSNSAWKPLPADWGETILEDQLALMFQGNSPPAELIALGDDARIRITCTIRGAQRLQGLAARASSSVNLRTNRIVVDAADRFKYRQRVGSGTFASILTGNSCARDDTTEIEAFAEKIRAAEDAAMVRGVAVLNTLNVSLKIGDVITEIDGRDVSLNRMAKTSATKKYVQIIEVNHDHQRQKTTLKLAPVLEAIQ